MNAPQATPTLSDVRAAADLLADVAQLTPMRSSRWLSDRVGGEDDLVTLAQRSISGDRRCTVGVGMVRATSRVLSLPRPIVGNSR